MITPLKIIVVSSPIIGTLLVEISFLIEILIFLFHLGRGITSEKIEGLINLDEFLRIFGVHVGMELFGQLYILSFEFFLFEIIGQTHRF